MNIHIVYKADYDQALWKSLHKNAMRKQESKAVLWLRMLKISSKKNYLGGFFIGCVEMGVIEFQKEWICVPR